MMGMLFGKDWKKAFCKSSDQCIPLSLTGSVLISGLVLHFFWVVGWATKLQPNYSQPYFWRIVFWASRLEISQTFPYGYTYLYLKLTSFVLDIFFHQHLCSTTAVLSPFYHTMSFVFNYFKLFLLLSRNSVLLSINMTKEKDMLANLFWGSEWLWIAFNSAKSWAICRKKKSKPSVCLLS